MKMSFLAVGLGAGVFLPGCSHMSPQHQTEAQIPPTAVRALEAVGQKLAPDPHMSIFQVVLHLDARALECLHRLRVGGDRRGGAGGVQTGGDAGTRARGRQGEGPG